jgi:hypothetical protein
VLYLKPGDNAAGESAGRNFCIVDAAMNDLMRPALYEAWMGIVACTQREEPPLRVDVVGPVCESGDWLGRDRDLAVHPGDRLAVLSAGAYGMSMASNYNSRGRPAEVMVAPIGPGWCGSASSPRICSPARSCCPRTCARRGKRASYAAFCSGMACSTSEANNAPPSGSTSSLKS